MPTARHLRLKSLKYSLNSQIIYFPTPQVSLEWNSSKTGLERALVDTGSSYNLIQYSYHKLLKIPESTLKQNPFKIKGIGEGKGNCYKWNLDLTVKSPQGDFINLPTSFFFTDTPMHWPIILGQHDFLEHVTLVHRNHSNIWEYVLKLK